MTELLNDIILLLQHQSIYLMLKLNVNGASAHVGSPHNFLKVFSEKAFVAQAQAQATMRQVQVIAQHESDATCAFELNFAFCFVFCERKLKHKKKRAEPN